MLSSEYTGEKGIFVKLGATVRYAGNYDYITLKYNLGQSADTAALYSDALTAENETTYLSVSGDDITAVNKSDGTASSVSAEEVFGSSVTFKKLINNKGMFTALIPDESGETKLVTSPMGTVWIDATPDYYAQADPDAPETVNINDFCVVGDRIYLGCDGGWLITMTSCATVSYTHLVASSANSYLINDVLRRTYGFDGFVVGDCGAWDNAFGRQPLRQKLYPDMKLDDITAPMTVAKIIAACSSLSLIHIYLQPQISSRLYTT